MIKILKCRRSSLAVVGMGLLFVLGYSKGFDTGLHIATVCAAVAAANAYEGRKNA